MAKKLTLLEDEWTRQPQIVRGINKKNTITRGLIILCNPAIGLENIAKPGTRFDGAIVKATGRIGLSARTDGSLSHEMADAAWNRPAEVTSLVFCNRAGGLQNYASPLQKDFNSTSGPSYSTWAIEYNAHAAGNNVITAFSSISGSYSRTAAYTFEDTSIPHVSVLTRSSSALCLFVNGMKVGENAGLSELSYSATGANNIQINNTVTKSPFDVYLVAIWDRVLSDLEIKIVSANPWQLFEPDETPLFKPVVTAQYTRPVSDVSAGGWTASTGSDLFAMLDETAADDGDYITTTSASTCEVALGSLNDPALSTGHVVRYRISATGGGIIVRLREGTTTIASWTHNPAPGSLTTYAQTLSGGEADSITNYAALKLQFEAIA